MQKTVSMKGWLTLVISSAGVSLSQGATEFEQSVPIELAHYFTDGGAIYSGLPESFPDIEMPESLQVMGAMERMNTNLVLLRSFAASEDALAELSGSLSRSGAIIKSIDISR